MTYEEYDIIERCTESIKYHKRKIKECVDEIEDYIFHIESSSKKIEKILESISITENYTGE